MRIQPPARLAAALRATAMAGAATIIAPVTVGADFDDGPNAAIAALGESTGQNRSRPRL